MALDALRVVTEADPEAGVDSEAGVCLPLLPPPLSMILLTLAFPRSPLEGGLSLQSHACANGRTMMLLPARSDANARDATKPTNSERGASSLPPRGEKRESITDRSDRSGCRTPN